MDITLVVAVAKNGVIGSDGGMPWRLSTDLKRFKMLTLGKPMVMGRKTFDAIGKALPGRTSIVVTRDATWQGEGAVAVRDLETAFDTARAIAKADGVDEICVVGGGEIYRQALGQATKLCLTEVDLEPDGDTFFTFDRQPWGLISQEHVPAGEKDSAPTTYCVFARSDP